MSKANTSSHSIIISIFTTWTQTKRYDYTPQMSHSLNKTWLKNNRLRTLIQITFFWLFSVQQVCVEIVLIMQCWHISYSFRKNPEHENDWWEAGVQEWFGMFSALTVNLSLLSPVTLSVLSSWSQTARVVTFQSRWSMEKSEMDQVSGKPFKAYFCHKIKI